MRTVTKRVIVNKKKKFDLPVSVFVCVCVCDVRLQLSGNWQLTVAYILQVSLSKSVKHNHIYICLILKHGYIFRST
jgi:hypothetical protein